MLENKNRNLWIPYILLLLVSVAILAWYPAQIIQAISGFSFTQGAFVGSDGKSQIFAFTPLGAAMAVALMAFWISKQEGYRKRYIPIAILVAYICTISVTMWYEQIYASLWDYANHTSYWFTIYSQPGKLLEVLVDMSLLLVALPWMRRGNLRLVGIFSGLTLLFFACWLATGFSFPTSSVPAYFFNGASRISSELAIAVSVFPLRGQSTNFV